MYWDEQITCEYVENIFYVDQKNLMNESLCLKIINIFHIQKKNSKTTLKKFHYYMHSFMGSVEKRGLEYEKKN